MSRDGPRSPLLFGLRQPSLSRAWGLGLPVVHFYLGRDFRMEGGGGAQSGMTVFNKGGHWLIVRWTPGESSPQMGGSVPPCGGIEGGYTVGPTWQRGSQGPLRSKMLRNAKDSSVANLVLFRSQKSFSDNQLEGSMYQTPLLPSWTTIQSSLFPCSEIRIS